MGTPASVASDPSPPPWQPPEPRTRKKATANIFKGVDLLQIQSLFKDNGDESAEDRARIIWECAGDSRIANALRHLRRKKSRVYRRETPMVTGDSVGVLSVQHFSQLCIDDGSYQACSQNGEIDPEEDPAPPSRDGASGGTTKRTVPHRSKRSKRVGAGQDPSAYLHQIRH